MSGFRQLSIVMLAASGAVCGLAIPVEAEAVQTPTTESDSAFADVVRLLIDSGSHPYLRWQRFTELRDELMELYAGADFESLWLHRNRPTPQAHDAVYALLDAGSHGLRPGDYDAGRLAALMDSIEVGYRFEPSDLALFDGALSVGFLRYLNSLYGGRVNPGNLHEGFDLPPPRLDLVNVVREAIQENTIGETVAGTAPGSVSYARLRRLLSDYRALAARDLPSIPEVTVVRAGDEYEGVDELQRLLAALGDLPAHAVVPDRRRYDGSLVAAVGCFQARHGLDVDGILGPETFAQLNTPIDVRIEQIEFAMERLRWIREIDQGNAVLVNIPAFTLQAFDASEAGSSPVLEMRVVVGEALDKQTPAFRSDLRYIEFSPYWNIPYSIAVKEILPAVARDPNHLVSHRMQIVREFGWDAEPMPETPDNLAAVRSGRLKLRQLPGPGNSLGGAKFMFPNPRNVYMHDTPAHQQFARSRRDFSHGCIRLEQPVELARWLLRDQEEWNRESIEEAMRAGSPLRVDLTRPVPVVILYTTMTVNGDLPHFYRDVYGHDAHLRAALSVGYPYPS
jgi:murein L,D-transpeptidase YcbB/YkuD